MKLTAIAIPAIPASGKLTAGQAAENPPGILDFRSGVTDTVSRPGKKA